MGSGKKTLRYIIIALLACATTFVACQNYVFMREDQHQTATERDFIPIDTMEKTDILFMVDNSNSMAEEQEKLAQNFEEFLKEILKGQNDFHMGIVTTDVHFVPLRACPEGFDCSSGAANLCGNPADMKFTKALTDTKAVKKDKWYCTRECSDTTECPLEYCYGLNKCYPAICGSILGFDDSKKYCYPETNGRLRACVGDETKCPYYQPAPGAPAHQKVLTDKLRKQIGDNNFINMFKDNVKVGTGGTGIEKGLASIRFALDADFKDPLTGKNLLDNENAGFLRPDAKLTVIVVTDEDDCSYEPDNKDLVDYEDPNTKDFL
ncbi:MAG: vWA domain-containing protein, partial [Myxococcota bacterium]